MSEHVLSEGEKAIDRCISVLRRSVVFPADSQYPLVIALWIAMTQRTMAFFSFPFLVICAIQKGAGKSTLGRLVSFGSRLGHFVQDPSPAAIVRWIKKTGGNGTLVWDEAEETGKAQGKFLQSLINSGWQKDGVIDRASGPEDMISWPSYCPKTFVMIGDPVATMADRSIRINLVKRPADAPEFDYETAKSEGEIVRARFATLLEHADVHAVSKPFMQGREREVWGGIFGVAEALALSPAKMEALVAAVHDNRGWQYAEKRVNRDTTAIDASEQDRKLARQCLTDLKALLKDSETSIWTATALERLRAMPTGIWRTVKGEGIDANMLTDWLKLAHVETGKQKKIGGINRNGFSCAQLRAAQIDDPK